MVVCRYGLKKSALALLVAGVLANNAHDVVAADDLAGFAKTFDGSSDFHARVADGWASALDGDGLWDWVTTGVAG
jgi:hypothetical protein